MKTKSLLLVATAAMTMASCSQNEIVETNPDTNRAIGFGVYTGTQTKGLVTDNSLTDGATANGLKVAGKGFGILAYQTDGNYSTSGAKGLFMDNVQAKWNPTGGSGSGGWEYSPTKFWPTNGSDKISFFAYAPFNAGATTGTPTGTNKIKVTGATGSEDPLLEFTLQDNQKDMVDLVVSGVKDQQSTTAGGKVTFAFKHALTRVAMHAKTSVATNAETKVYITGIKLKHTKKLAQKATFDMNDATWELPATTPGNDYLAAEYAIAATSADGVLKLADPAWKSYTTPAVEINSIAVNLFTDDQYLFFIPIDGTTGTGAASDVVAAISYDIVSLPSSGATTAVASSFTKEVDLGANVFAQGKAYKFTFTITLNAITVDVDDFDWDTETNKPVTVN